MFFNWTRPLLTFSSQTWATLAWTECLPAAGALSFIISVLSFVITPQRFSITIRKNTHSSRRRWRLRPLSTTSKMNVHGAECFRARVDFYSLHFDIMCTQINKDGWRISTSSHLKAGTFAAVRWDLLAVKLASEASGGQPMSRVWGPELWSSVQTKPAVVAGTAGRKCTHGTQKPRFEQRSRKNRVTWSFSRWNKQWNFYVCLF